jgi:hypothetical protein
MEYNISNEEVLSLSGTMSAFVLKSLPVDKQ